MLKLSELSWTWSLAPEQHYSTVLEHQVPRCIMLVKTVTNKIVCKSLKLSVQACTVQTVQYVHSKVINECPFPKICHFPNINHILRRMTKAHPCPLVRAQTPLDSNHFATNQL